MIGYLRRCFNSLLIRMNIKKKKTPLFVIKVDEDGFVHIRREEKDENTIFVSNIQPYVYDILLKNLIEKPHRTVIIKSRYYYWYSRGKLINKNKKDVISPIIFLLIAGFVKRK